MNDVNSGRVPLTAGGLNASLVSSDGQLTVVRASDHETLAVHGGFFFKDDFWGKGAYSATAGSNQTPWVKYVTGTPTTSSLGVNRHGGWLEQSLAATSEEEQAAIDFGDVLAFNPLKVRGFEFKVDVTVIPTGNSVLALGLGTARNKDFEALSQHMTFNLAGASALLKFGCDDNSTDTASVSTGVTCVPGTPLIVRAELRDLTNIAIYVNGVQKATSSTFAMAATVATDLMQPFITTYKASGTGVGALNVDYCAVWGIK